MPISVSQQPMLLNYASRSGTLQFTFASGGGVALGDLLVIHAVDGTNATGGSGANVTNADGVAWTKAVGYLNGRAVFTKVATARDIGNPHSLAQTGSGAQGYAFWSMRQALSTVNAQSGVLAGTTTTLPATSLASIVFKVYYGPSGATVGDFPDRNTADSSQQIEWKSFAANASKATMSSATTAWHSNDSRYVVLVFDEETAPSAPAADTATGRKQQMML